MTKRVNLGMLFFALVIAVAYLLAYMPILTSGETVVDRLTPTQGSVAWADNDFDRSYMAPNFSEICDGSPNNGRSAVEKVFDQSGDFKYWIRDNTDDSRCETADRSGAEHSTCIGYWDGAFHGCGSRSIHNRKKVQEGRSIE